MSLETKSIYDEEGRIEDKDTAHEIANLEKPARDREIGLQKQAEKGLDTEEEFNLALIEKFHEKYPFVPQTIFEGSPAFVIPAFIEPLSRFESPASKRYRVLTKDGGYNVDFEVPVPTEAINNEFLLKTIKTNVEGLKYYKQQSGDTSPLSMSHRALHINSVDTQPVDMAAYRKVYPDIMLSFVGASLSTLDYAGDPDILKAIRNDIEEYQGRLKKMEKNAEDKDRIKKGLLENL